VIQRSIYGRLGRDPKAGTTKTGKPMCTASVAVDVGKEPGEETLWLTVLAFGHLAETLQRHQQGDMVGAIGRLTRSHYTATDGQERESWTLLAEALHSSRTVRPHGAKRRGPGEDRRGPGAGAGRPGNGHPGQTPDFDDPVGF
jgi:single-stranded DNA-binding protein